MQRILSVIAGVLLVGTPASLSAQQEIAAAAARRAAMRATAAIQGSAIDSSNGVLVNTLVRVRDARLGRIVDQSLTSKVGAYTFKGLEPGSYIVEIVSNKQTTIGTTSLISANAGQTVTAVVRLPFTPSLIGAILGQQAPATSAAAAGFGDLVPQIVQQLPQTIIQAVPAMVPAGPPVSEQ
jgi:hypothetical protein